MSEPLTDAAEIEVALRAPEGASCLLARESRDGAEQKALELVVAAVRRWVAHEVDARAIEAAGTIPESLVRSAAAIGLFGLTIPEAHDGFGLSLKAACRVIDEVARECRSTAIMVGLHAGLGTRPLVAHGSAVQHARWLPDLASGRRVASFAATEPGAGSSLLSMSTTARSDGAMLRLDGEKSYVTNGGFAGLYTLVVRTPDFGGAKAQSLVCVEAGTPGLHVGSEEDKLGIRASSTVSLHLDDVRVPHGQLLGTPGKGSELAHSALAWGRTLMSAGCLGAARRALDTTVAHVRARRQLGKALAEQPLVRAQVAEMAARLYGMEALVRWAASREEDERALGVLSTWAKVACSDGAHAIADLAVQLHGALGFLEPTGVARILRDVRITRIFEGANDVLLLRAGVARLSAKAAVEPRRLAASTTPALRDAAEAFDATRDAFHATVRKVRRDYAIAAVRQQAILACLARAELELHLALAALLRARGEGDPAAVSLGEHAALLALARADAHLEEARRADRVQRRAEGVVATLLDAEPRATVERATQPVLRETMP